MRNAGLTVAGYRTAIDETTVDAAATGASDIAVGMRLRGIRQTVTTQLVRLLRAGLHVI